MVDRPKMYDWSDICDYMEELEAENAHLRGEVERLRKALENAIAHARNWKDIASDEWPRS